MLHAKNLPVKLWAEAVNTTCYILNRTPTVGSQGMTPYEAWTNRKPRLDHIRVFGSDAYAHVSKQLRKKWDKKSQKLILVGYHADSHNYRLFDPHTGKIIISRDVAIHETNYYLQRNSEDESQIIVETHRSLRNEDKSPSDEDDDSEQDVPAHKNNLRILRDRDSIKPPDRYQANLANTTNHHHMRRQ